MAVRFLLGRAGTGKTAHCLGGIVAAILEAPLGPPLLWIVPEQTTFNTERLLATHPDIAGTFRAQVTSFRRLATTLADELGLGGGADLDELSRTILLTDLVARLKGKLTLFGPVADRPGFIQRLDAMLRELQQSGHTGASLRAVAAELRGSTAGSTGGAGDPILIRKLNDLAVLLEGWDALLAQRQLPTQRLAEAVAHRLHELDSLRGARVWIDAFSGFNLLEMRMIAALVRQCAEVEITLTLDPQTRAMRDLHVPLDEMSLFARTERTYRGLAKMLEEDGARILEPGIFARRWRFKEAADLERVEFGLFGGDRGTGVSPVDAANIAMWECASPLAEVRAAAQHIKRMMAAGETPALPGRTPALRYRDIALVIPDLEGYADPVRRIFSQHGIPHFIDQRRSIAHHPLVELLRSAVGLPLNGFGNDDVAILLKTGLTPVQEKAGHLLENYLLAHGLTQVDLARPFGFLLTDEGEEQIDALPTEAQVELLKTVNAARETLMAGLARWLKVAREAKRGEDFVAGLKFLLEDMQAAEAMENLLAQAREAGDVELAMIHTQAYGQMVGLLETLGRLLLGREMTLDQFAAVLTGALESMTLGLIPPTLDQVLVSSVTRSRHPEIQVAIILGALETRFPMVKAEDPLMNDHQREAFNGHTRQQIEPGTDRQLLEARFFDYIAFTRASRKLVVSYPLADAQGRAVAPSPYVRKLGALFPGLLPLKIGLEELHKLENICTLDDALTAALLWGRRLENMERTQEKEEDEPLLFAMAAENKQDKKAKREVAAMAQGDLYAWLKTQEDQTVRRVADAALEALAPAREPAISAGHAAKFYPGPIRMSVTQLERYASCPLQYFLMYTLGLKERPRLQLDVMNMGTLYHRVLEKVYGEVILGRLAWPGCKEGELKAVLQKATEGAARELHQELASTLPQYPKVLRRTVYTLGIVLEAQRRAALVGDMRPAATELTFGIWNGDRKALPVLEIATPAGRVAQINGKIDRVDIAADGAAAVLDYKSSARELELHLLLNGLGLQLPVYLLAIQDLGAALGKGKLDPVAALFVPLGRSRRMSDGSGAASDPNEDAFYQQSLPRGVIDAAGIGELDRQAETFSQWYKYKRNKDESLRQFGNDAYEHKDFAVVLRYVRMKAAAMVDALASGRIGPHPYRNKKQIPCDYCDFQEMCQFDRVRGEFKNIVKEKRAEVLERMERQLEKAARDAGGDRGKE